MNSLIELVFDSEHYMPHGYCLLWRPELVWMHVLGDILVTLAYFSIPIIILVLLIKRRQSLPFRWVLVLFAAFIFLCGITHLLSVITLWQPYYYLEGILKVITAAVSLATALMIFPLLPNLLDLLASSPPSEEGPPKQVEAQ